MRTIGPAIARATGPPERARDARGPSDSLSPEVSAIGTGFGGGTDRIEGWAVSGTRAAARSAPAAMIYFRVVTADLA